MKFQMMLACLAVLLSTSLLQASSKPVLNHNQFIATLDATRHKIRHDFVSLMSSTVTLKTFDRKGGSKLGAMLSNVLQQILPKIDEALSQIDFGTQVNLSESFVSIMQGIVAVMSNAEILSKLIESGVYGEASNAVLAAIMVEEDVWDTMFDQLAGVKRLTIKENDDKLKSRVFQLDLFSSIRNMQILQGKARISILDIYSTPADSALLVQLDIDTIQLRIHSKQATYKIQAFVLAHSELSQKEYISAYLGLVRERDNIV